MIRKLLIIFILCVGATLVFAVLAWRDYRQFENGALVETGTLTLIVEPGETLSTLVLKLDRLGLGQRDWRWRLAGRLHRPSIQTGEYRVEPGLSRREVLAQLARGDVVRHRFTIIEGWTLARLRRALAADSRLVQHVPDLSPEALMQRLGCDGCFAEGRFLPETYQFVRGDREFDLLARSHRAMGRELERAWQQRDPGLPLAGPDELLILASLVEMETMIDRERARVAGVFVRRLQRGMRLQTDPTVVYGLDDGFDGRIRRIHLRTDHPWNTYTRHGLPPTPIGLPGVASIRAAASPADGSALYFVARGDGSHVFSDTLAEHNRAVQRYILGRPAAPTSKRPGEAR